jgi:hypothetical protein
MHKLLKYILSMHLTICKKIQHRIRAIITCQSFLIVLFQNSHKHFTNVIGKLRMVANIHGAKEHETRD